MHLQKQAFRKQIVTLETALLGKAYKKVDGFHVIFHFNQKPIGPGEQDKQ
jgi:hypothetical protein